MDFAPTEAQRNLTELTRTILTEQVTHQRLREVESAPDRFDRPLWRTLATAGVLGAGLPADIGGGGCGVLEECSVAVEMGRAVAPIPHVSSMMMAAGALARFGTAEQRQRWARPAASGELLPTVALFEDPSGEPTLPGTSAAPSHDGWTLTGGKSVVPAGGVAELILVPAETPDGLSVFVVRPDDPGVLVTRQQIVDGDSEANVELDGATLPGERLLGAAGTGAGIVEWLMRRGTIGLCAHQLGVTECALRTTAEYARNRTQFDKVIGSFQAVAQRLADAYIDVEAIRLTMWQAAWLIAEEHAADTAIGTAKFWAADGGHRVAHTTVHIHGGVGLDLDSPPHRYFVAAKRNEFTLGAATAQLRGIGNALAAEPA